MKSPHQGLRLEPLVTPLLALLVVGDRVVVLGLAVVIAASPEVDRCSRAPKPEVNVSSSDACGDSLDLVFANKLTKSVVIFAAILTAAATSTRDFAIDSSPSGFVVVSSVLVSVSSYEDTDLGGRDIGSIRWKHFRSRK